MYGNRRFNNIFIDPNEPLHVPLNTSGSTGYISVTVKRDEYVPCLPTHSSITLTLSLPTGPVLPIVSILFTKRKHMINLHSLVALSAR